MQHEREVAGLRCGQVLARLSDYVDGSLTAEEREALEAHVRGCDNCERFGGSFAKVLGALRARGADEAKAAALLRARERLGG